MPAVFGTIHVDDIADLRRRGHDPILLEEEQVAAMFGARTETPPPDCRYALVILPRSVLEIVTASDPTLPSDRPLRLANR